MSDEEKSTEYDHTTSRESGKFGLAMRTTSDVEQRSSFLSTSSAINELASWAMERG